MQSQSPEAPAFARIIAQPVDAAASLNPVIVALVSAFGAEFFDADERRIFVLRGCFLCDADAQEFVFRIAIKTIPA